MMLNNLRLLCEKRDIYNDIFSWISEITVSVKLYYAFANLPFFIVLLLSINYSLYLGIVGRK
jgi:hypothetical protein